MIIPNEAEGEWKPARPLIRCPLGADYSLMVTRRFELYERFEGIITFSHEEWTLFCGEEEVISFIEPYGLDPEKVFDEIAANLPETERDSMRQEFYLSQPTTRKEAVAKRAKKIWESGEALAFLESTAQRMHVGDSVAIRAMFLSYVSIKVDNCEGIHVSISGDTGTGKSHLIATILSLLPENATIDARFSDKALYHHKIPAGVVLVIDDQNMSENFSEAFKNASTNWDKPSKYLTVSKNEGVVLYLPERCVFWVSKANINGDEQVVDRQIMLWTDSSDAQRHAVHTQLFARAASPKKVVEENADAEVCRALFAFLNREVVKVPFAMQIRCNDSMDSRTVKILLALIQAHCLLCGAARKRDSDGVLEAEVEDFYGAMFVLKPLFANQKGSQSMKLSSGSARVLEYLKDLPSGLVSFSDIMRACQMSNSALSHALWGRTDRKTDGLFAACPAIELVSQTVSEQDVDIGDRRKSVTRKMIRWSHESYEAWLSRVQGGFWIEGDS